MWTVLGVMFFIGAAGWGIIKAVGLFVIGAGSAASGQEQVQKKINEAREEERRRERLRQQRTMTQDFRRWKIQEEPVSVKVGETHKVDYINRPGCVSVHGKKYYECVETFADRMFDPGFRDRGKYIYTRNKTEANGYTSSLSKYLTEIELIDSMTPGEWWIKSNTPEHPEKLDYLARKRYEDKMKQGPPADEVIINNSGEYSCCYTRARERQITEYCNTVSMLAHRYIYFGAYSEFKEYFIRVLIGDREALMNFLHECHAANVWKEQYEQLYDCENYMQDFMEENNIQEKMNALAGHEVLMPDDFRHYREQSPNKTVANHIDHELARERRDLQKAEIKLHSKKGWGAAFIATFIGIALIAGALYLFSQNRDSIQWTIWILAVYALFWSLIVASPAVDDETVKNIEKQEEEEKKYVNPSPYPLNKEGAKFAEHLYKEILEQHTAPYKFYEAVKAAMSPPLLPELPDPEEQEFPESERQEQALSEPMEQKQESPKTESRKLDPQEQEAVKDNIVQIINVINQIAEQAEKKEKKMDRKGIRDEIVELETEFIEGMIKLCDKYDVNRTTTIIQVVDELKRLVNRRNFNRYEVRK